MQPIALGSWRLEHSGLSKPADVIERRQIGRYYDFDGRFVSGLVDTLEEEWRTLAGRSCALATSSATHALTTALNLAEVRGGEVVLPAYAFAACASAIVAAGAKPVVVPCGSRVVPSVEQLLAAATSRTRAFMPVHMRGIPMDVSGLRAALGNAGGSGAGATIIEDCSQFDGLVAGTAFESGAADIAVYSFQARKLVTAGEGGMLTFDDPELQLRAVQATDSAWYMRPQWSDAQPPSGELSGSRMNEVTAALLLVQLEGLKEFCADVRALRRAAHAVLGHRSMDLAQPGLEPGGTLVLRGADDRLREALRGNGFPVYPESGAPSDPHRSSGWPSHLGVYGPQDTEILDGIALVQVRPDWDESAIGRLFEIVDTHPAGRDLQRRPAEQASNI